MNKEKLSILLQDGIAVRKGMTVYRVTEKCFYNRRYEHRRKLRKNEVTLWSGGLAHELHEDEVIRVEEGFNLRVFTLRDTSGSERNYSVNSVTSASSRYSSVDLVYGTKKAAVRYIKENNQQHLDGIKTKISKYTEGLTKFKVAEKVLKANLTRLK